MTEDSPRGLFIPLMVLALPKLTLTARLVLAEILNLHKVRGEVFARDSHFAGRLGVSLRTIGNAIAELEAQSYLTRPYDPAAKQKRSLVLGEKCLQELQGVVADFARTKDESLQNLQPLAAETGQNSPKCLQKLPGVVADFADINNKLNKKNKALAEGECMSVQNLDSSPIEHPISSAVGASYPTAASSSAEQAQLPTSSPTKPAGKNAKRVGAKLEEVAALPLPFDGKDFAEAWCTFYSENPKQAGKPLSAFVLMLKKLAKYPEGFAVVMLEQAVMRVWQGIENDGTPAAFETWKAEQARLAARPAAAPIAPPSYDPAALFGLDSSITAAQALARNRETPEYAAYLAREAARQAQGGATFAPGTTPTS